MSSAGAEGDAYEVHNSVTIARDFLRLQRQAKREGRGEELLQATHAVYERLRQDPAEFGEPLYQLPTLRMAIRCAVVRPLVIDFAVCDDRPLVFIKAVRLLAAEEN
jgi:hypothetical protein